MAKQDGVAVSSVKVGEPRLTDAGKAAAIKTQRRRLTDAEKAIRDGEKRVRFLRLIGPRVNSLIKRCKHVAALANKGSYAYNPEQAEKVIAACKAAVKQIEEAFCGSIRKEELFSL